MHRFNRTILSAIHTYITDHPKDLDMYTAELRYEYNCQPQTSTVSAPFELVLSRAPSPIETKAEQPEPQTKNDLKSKWKLGIQKTLATPMKKLLEALRGRRRIMTTDYAGIAHSSNEKTTYSSV